MADIERIYNVPLRKESHKAPKYKRLKKAVIALREFIQKHMKCENVKIGRYANLKLHERGRKNPPHHIKIKAVKATEKINGRDVEVVRAELVGAPEEKKIEEKKEVKPEEKTEEKKEKKLEEEVKREVLEKGLEEKKKPEMEIKNVDKEASIKQKRELIIGKTEKPHHEKKR